MLGDAGELRDVHEAAERAEEPLAQTVDAPHGQRAYDVSLTPRHWQGGRNAKVCAALVPEIMALRVRSFTVTRTTLRAVLVLERDDEELSDRWLAAGRAIEAAHAAIVKDL